LNLRVKAAPDTSALPPSRVETFVVEPPGAVVAVISHNMSGLLISYSVNDDPSVAMIRCLSDVVLPTAKAIDNRGPVFVTLDHRHRATAIDEAAAELGIELQSMPSRQESDLVRELKSHLTDIRSLHAKRSRLSVRLRNG
jgi:hypothetical protein